MKIRFGALVFLLISALACSEKSDNNSILNVNIKGLNQGTVYLERLHDSTLVRIDSVLVEQEAPITLSTTLDSPEMLYLHVSVDASELIDTRLPVFMESGIVEVKTRLNSLQAAAVITGSQNHKKWQEYQQSIRRYSDKNLELIKASLEAQQVQNDSLVNAIDVQQRQLLRSRYLASINFAKNNTAYAVSPYIMLNEARAANTKFLDTVFLALQDSVKTGTYGKALLALIESQKAAQNEQ